MHPKVSSVIDHCDPSCHWKVSVEKCFYLRFCRVSCGLQVDILAISNCPICHRKKYAFSMLYHRFCRYNNFLDIWLSISKLTLIPLTSYDNQIYYIPFDAPRLTLQNHIPDFSILNRSPYSTGSFDRGQNFWYTLSIYI